MTALLVSAAFLLTTAALVGVSSGYPPMNDITTDLDNPVPLADANGADIPYPARFASRQREGYPDLQSERFGFEPAVVGEAAEAVARAAGWDIVHVGGTDGLIMAVATTVMFRFKDDVAIRITATGDTSIVDVRSRSRVGRSDLGANAKRIRRFLADLRARLG